ncbi:transglycosylase SLT domain-containing protein [Pontibacter sp. JH31]|uniref:Transglycosylase SLT domain-containing protein n=1 Tax=Pontibacter aquaedesilientis TaxID=2766980 RepID=A0ABR7XDQ1_9BACT|nr:lytic transglycosylase domain-containing protein [Pontibacter aquaedesilientis]MBD1396425.1 transglycosylase SLT domain-containing protein [Pontibacter aquaedesilientis]
MGQQFLKYGWILVAPLLILQLSSENTLKLSATPNERNGKVFESNRQMFSSPALPDAITFAGEPVPLHVPDVAERLDRELLANAYLHTSTLMALKRMQRYVPEIKQMLQENNIPEDFVYLALAESLLSHVTSPAGASGFWQLMPDTARGYGMIVNSEVDERYHIQKSTLAACRYLKTAKSKFGTWTNAAASYNRGMGGIDRAMKQQGVSDYYDLYLNDETSRYMFRILALKEILGNPKKYGFDLPEEHGYKPLTSKPLTVNKTITDLPAFALEQGINYKTLRLYNPWIRGYKLTVPDGKTYVLQMPM